MSDDTLAARFEAERPRLRMVAHRLLGSAVEADDAVQETWLRLSRADVAQIANLGGWLTTAISRVCLDRLRTRRARREQPLPPADSTRDRSDPERDAVISESVGLAMVSVMERLAPAERVAFVLHDAFGVPFEEIAGIVDRSPAAARQLASRGRRRLQGTATHARVSDLTRHREVVEAFFRASRAGDLGALLAVLDPNVVLRADEAALQMGSRTRWLASELRGRKKVADQFAGQAQAAELALIDGVPGAVWAPGGRPRVAFVFAVGEGRILEIELVADTARLGRMEIEVVK